MRSHVHTVFVKLFTRNVLTDPEQGRTLIRLIEQYAPCWMPHRYGWSVPLRNTYDRDRFEDFWTGLEYNLDWRNAKRTATGHVTTRVGPRDTLSSIGLTGEQTHALDLATLADLVQGSARPLDLVYGVLHLFHPDDLYTGGHGGRLFRENRGTPPPFLAVQESGLRECLPDLAWGNVFGAPYVELFGGAERVRSTPAARVTQVGPERYYLQLTDDITDVQQNRAAFTAAREAAKEHLGADCFAGYPGPLRAPRLPMAAEEGLWSPPAGFDVPDELREMLDQAVREGKTLPPPSGVIEKGRR
jgi:hypothetical protein